MDKLGAYASLWIDRNSGAPGTPVFARLNRRPVYLGPAESLVQAETRGTIWGIPDAFPVLKSDALRRRYYVVQ